MSRDQNYILKIGLKSRPTTTSQTQVAQLSMWDDEAVEQGYRLLNDLKFDAAAQKFTEALNGGMGRKNELDEAILACRYWEKKLGELNDLTGIETEELATFLDALRTYRFTSLLKKFRYAVLESIATKFQNLSPLDHTLVQDTVDLLIKEENLDTAIDLLQKNLIAHPQNTELVYKLAQVYWLSGELQKANDIYADQLLRHPSQVIVDRIMNEKLQNTIQKHGSTMAIVYAVLYEVLELNKIPQEMTLAGEDHRMAVDCLFHIRESEKAMKSGDLQESIHHRKQLFKLSPEVSKAYIAIVRSRDRQGNRN